MDNPQGKGRASFCSFLFAGSSLVVNSCFDKAKMEILFRTISVFEIGLNLQVNKQYTMKLNILDDHID